MEVPERSEVHAKPVEQQEHFGVRDWNGLDRDWDVQTGLWREVPVQEPLLDPGKRFQVSAERSTASWAHCEATNVEEESAQGMEYADVWNTALFSTRPQFRMPENPS